MTLSQHEWIENAGTYEAVFQCMNPLGKWDRDAHVRAFQAFDWDDASVDNNELTFAHIETGSFIKYDGGVVAVKLGDSILSNALPDLFGVLTGLGWQLAKVHHPAHSMRVFMADIGRAIPANMNFEVVAAEATESFSLTDGASLLKHGATSLKGHDDGLIFNELESMTAPQAEIRTVAPAVAVAVQHKDLLLDVDVEDHIDDHSGRLKKPLEVPSPLYPSQQPQAASHTAQASVKKIDAPDFDELVASAVQHLTAKHSSIQAALVIENENLRDALALANDRLTVEQEHARRWREEQDDLHSPWLLPEHSTPVTASNADLAVDIFQGIPMKNSTSVVRVGVSALCFDLPGNRLSDDAVKLIAEDFDAPQIVHLQPGAIGQPLRWDVLGDIAPEYPWGAQQLACAMGFSRVNAALVASIFLELKANIVSAELRDVVSVCASSGFDSKVKMDQLLVNVGSPGMKSLFSRLSPPALMLVLDEIVLHLGGLLLCPQGQAFVDVRPAPDDLASKNANVFSIRELMESPIARLLVIHVDSLDGPFATWITDLLRDVALSYASTTRYSLVALDAPVDALADASVDSDAEAEADAALAEQVNQIQQAELENNQALMADVNAIVGNLILQLRRLGVSA